MTNLEWMQDKIKLQVRSVRKQISGLPEDLRESITNECIDILKQTLQPETPPFLDKDGCVYWDHIL